MTSFLRRSFRQGLFFGVLVLSALPAPGQQQEEPRPAAPQCRGYRYAFIREAGDRVQFFACRRILEPSSRPADCQMFGEIKTEEVRRKLKSKAYSYIAGYSLGVACSLGGQLASKFSVAVGGLFSAYNYGAQRSSAAAMQEEVLRGERRLGEAPNAESHYKSFGRKLCSYFAEDAHSLFASGTRQAIHHIGTMTMEAEALHADSNLIWRAPPEQRAALFEEFQRNVARRQERRARMIDGATHILGEIVEYAMSGELSNVPFGVTDEIAIVPDKSCIPAPDLVKAAESLRTFPGRVDEMLRALEPDTE